MTGSKDAWAEVDRRFSEFGRIVAERHRKAGEEQQAPPTQQAKRSLEEAFSVVTKQLDVAFSAAGDTIRDPEAKETLKQAGKAVMNALGSTVTDVGNQIRKRGGDRDG
jgi:hypothetical protein